MRGIRAASSSWLDGRTRDDGDLGRILAENLLVSFSGEYAGGKFMAVNKAVNKQTALGVATSERKGEKSSRVSR
jgi:hypothetical protein